MKRFPATTGLCWASGRRCSARVRRPAPNNDGGRVLSSPLPSGSLRGAFAGCRSLWVLVNSASFGGWFFRLLHEQRFLEDEPPVFLDLRLQLGVVQESPSVG